MKSIYGTWFYLRQAWVLPLCIQLYILLRNFETFELFGSWYAWKILQYMHEIISPSAMMALACIKLVIIPGSNRLIKYLHRNKSNKSIVLK